MGQDKLILQAEKGTSFSTGNLRLYAFVDSKAVGAIDLYAYDPINHRCAMGIVVATEFRRQGFAKEMLHQLDSIAAVNYHMHQIYADVVSTNVASLTLLRSAGYIDCGKFSEWLLIGDQYIDSIRLQKLL